MQDPKSILITGASSGIGEALALAYAEPRRNLALTGRDGARLNQVAEACRTRGAEVMAETVPVEDRDRLADFIGRADAVRPLDLVIANAGISRSLRELGDLDRVARETFLVNVEGVFNTLHPAIDRMLPRRQGQLAIVSSLAAYRGLSSAAAYSASKAAVRAYGEALRGRLAHAGLQVSVATPGFVRTRLTEKNRFPMPFLMDAPQAAEVIKRGLARNRGRIAFPFPLYALIRLVTMLPDFLVDRLMMRLPNK